MKVTILFDREKTADSLYSGWGIAYLIDDLLFDTGEKPEYLLGNIEALRVDATRIRKIILSHNNWDHRSGLWGVLARNKDAQVYACPDFLEEFKEKIKDYGVTPVTEFRELSPGMYSSGCVTATYKSSKFLEQFVIARTGNGISCIFGCAHPGILALLQKAKEYFPQEKIYSVFGGFHLMEADPRMIFYIAHEMKNMGVKKVGPSHCSGYEAITIFKEVYKEDFLDIKVGLDFEI